MSPRITVGEVQAAGLQIYLLDPVHAEFGEPFPGTLAGRVLTVTDVARARDMVCDVCNATEEEDPQISAALTALYDRLCRAARDGR